VPAPPRRFHRADPPGTTPAYAPRDGRLTRAAVAGAFLSYPTQTEGMETTRKGLRDGDLHKDTYERLACTACDETLKKKNDPDEVFSVRTCPECGAEWKELR